jgi:hypothetical protein
LVIDSHHDSYYIMEDEILAIFSDYRLIAEIHKSSKMWVSQYAIPTSDCTSGNTQNIKVLMVITQIHLTT